MPVYIFRAAYRTPSGTFGRALAEQTIEAPNKWAAIAAARAIETDVSYLEANAVYLVDERERVIWSLYADISDLGVIPRLPFGPKVGRHDRRGSR